MQTHSHASEGFALGWSPQSVGSFACGDCSGALHVWSPKEGGSWTVSGPYAGHGGSVEDIQWSPTEATVFATACVDKVRHTASHTGTINTIASHNTLTAWCCDSLSSSSKTL
jgi:WD40 repeat protein